MEIPYNPEATKESKIKEQTKELSKPKEVQVQPVIQPVIQPTIQPATQPIQEKNPDKLLIGIYLKEDENSIDYYYNNELIEFILLNKNMITGILEGIKLDVLLGDKQE